MKDAVPCDVGECPHDREPLLLCNAFAFELFQKLSTQVITAGMGEVIGIQFSAIKFLFDIYQIDDPYEKQDLFDKIMVIESVRMEMRRSELEEKNATDNKTEKSKKKGRKR